MKKRLALTFWAIGSVGAILFALFWAFAIAYTRRFSLGALMVGAFGVFLTCEALKAWKREKQELGPADTLEQDKRTVLWRALVSCNIGSVVGAIVLIAEHSTRTIVYQTIGLLFVVMNAYLFFSFRIWGSKAD